MNRSARRTTARASMGMLALFVLATVTWWVFTPPAAAHPTFVERFGETGHDPGQFGNGRIGGIAVDPESGDVFASDTNGFPDTPEYRTRVQRFTSSGEFLYSIGETGTGAERLKASLEGIAISPVNDLLYVIERGYPGGRIVRYELDGTFVDELAVVTSENYDTAARDAYRIAINAESGDVYISSSGVPYLRRYDADGEFLGGWGTNGSGDGQFQHGYPQGLTVDPVSGDVFVGANNRIQRFTADGTFITKYGQQGPEPDEFSGINGLLYEPESDGLFVSDGGNARVKQIGADWSLRWLFGRFITATTPPWDALPYEFGTPGNMAFDPGRQLLFVDDYIKNTVNVYSMIQPECENVSGQGQDEAKVTVALECREPQDRALTYELVDPPAAGTATIADPSQPVVEFTPPPGGEGQFAFSYRAIGPDAESEPATASVAVTRSPVDPGPDPDPDPDPDPGPGPGPKPDPDPTPRPSPQRLKVTAAHVGAKGKAKVRLRLAAAVLPGDSRARSVKLERRGLTEAKGVLRGRVLTVTVRRKAVRRKVRGKVVKRRVPVKLKGVYRLVPVKPGAGLKPVRLTVR